MYFLLKKALLIKKIQFTEKKSKLDIKDSIGILQGLIEFIKGLIAIKDIFEVILGFNLKKLKSRGWIKVFKSLFDQIKGLNA